MTSLFEQMGGTYTLGDDGYYYPDLTLPKDTNFSFGRYGRLHKDYLKKNKNSVYRKLLYLGKLNTCLAEIDAQAKEMLQKLTREMVQSQGITEQLKADDQLKWVGLMNIIKHCAEEIVFEQLVYN